MLQGLFMLMVIAIVLFMVVRHASKTGQRKMKEQEKDIQKRIAISKKQVLSLRDQLNFARTVDNELKNPELTGSLVTEINEKEKELDVLEKKLADHKIRYKQSVKHDAWIEDKYQSTVDGATRISKRGCAIAVEKFKKI